MRRRTFLASAAATLAAPSVVRAAGTGVLKFVPFVDIPVLDPIANTAAPTRTHAFLVFDTLFGMDEQMQAQPQMAEGVVVDADAKDWTITLREGLKFHDNTPVLGRDVVASIKRWGVRDTFAISLMSVVDEISAPTDRTIRIRLNKSFRLLPEALGKCSPNMPAIMPERIAAGTDPFKSVAELIGSGPFRFLPGERVPGARVVYERFAGYVPRSSGKPSLTAGPKIVHLDRVEWLTMPETATAVGALQSGEVDWLETPPPDLLPQLRRDKRVVVKVHDFTGQMAILRLNCIIPPFDNEKLRRAVLRAIDQTEFMSAYSTDSSLWRAPVGIWPTDTPNASKAGMDGLFGPTNVERAKAEIAASGYKGERIVVMSPSDHPVNGPMANVACDLFRRIGLNVEQQSMDSGTMFQRRNSKQGLDKGGWNVFPSAINGIGQLNPADSFLARGNGPGAWYGWPTSPRTEALHEAYLASRSEDERRKICADLQVVALEEAPSLPLGQVVSPTAYSARLQGVSNGFPRFWGVSKP